MCSFKCKETSKFILLALYWKYVHSSTRRKIKAGKKNLNVKIFNLQYDAMGYTTYSFTISIKMSLLGMEGILVGYPMFGRKIFDIRGTCTQHVPNCLKKFQWNIVFILWAKQRTIFAGLWAIWVDRFYVCFLNHTHKIRTRIIYLCLVEPWIKERLNLLLYKIYIMTMILP